MLWQRIGLTAMIGLLVIAFALVANAQSRENNESTWPSGYPNPNEHVQTGPDQSFYAGGLISWIHFAGSKEHPELDDFRSSYFAHFRFGEDASVLIPGEAPPRDWVHSLPASPYLPPQGE